MPKKPRRRSKRFRILLGVLVIALIAGGVGTYFLYFKTDPDPSTYFLKHRKQLKLPLFSLTRSFQVGLNSWEEPGGPPIPQGPTQTVAPRRQVNRNEMSFFIGLKNNSKKTIAVADIIVEPSNATAAGVRLVKEEFETLSLSPGAEREVELKTTIVKDSSVPTPKLHEVEAKDFGVRLYVVAAFSEDVPNNWQNQSKPEEDSAFKKRWGDFALISRFTEIPASLLMIRYSEETSRSVEPSPK